jgi:hypothetical protein
MAMILQAAVALTPEKLKSHHHSLAQGAQFQSQIIR